MRFIQKFNFNIIFIIIVGIIFRFLLIDVLGDTKLENEWRILFENLYNKGILSFKTFENEQIPSVYMPPLYVFFLYIVKIILPENLNLVKSVLFFQSLISGVTIYFFYKINLFFFSKKISLFSSFILFFLPINIISSLNISSITIQLFLNILFLYLLALFLKNKKNFYLFIFFGVVCALNMYLRGEFILIFIFTLTFLFFYKLKLKEILLIVLISVITLSPYLIRNYILFEKVTITNSFGYNLWKGNNIDSKVEGSESNLAFNYKNLSLEINKIQKNKFYEINYDNLFLDRSIDFIKENKILFIKRYILKFFSFLFIDFESTYPLYYNFFNIVPIFLISIAFLISVIFFIKYPNQNLFFYYLLINIFLIIFIFSFFFILPRYKLMIIPSQLIFINTIFLRLSKNV